MVGKDNYGKYIVKINKAYQENTASELSPGWLWAARPWG